jgi:hypothetical protein
MLRKLPDKASRDENKAEYLSFDPFSANPGFPSAYTQPKSLPVVTFSGKYLTTNTKSKERNHLFHLPNVQVTQEELLTANPFLADGLKPVRHYL